MNRTNFDRSGNYRILIMAATATGMLALQACTLGATMQQQATVLNTPCKDDMAVVVSDEVADLNGDERWLAECEGARYSCIYSPDSGASCYPAK